MNEGRHATGVGGEAKETGSEEIRLNKVGSGEKICIRESEEDRLAAREGKVAFNIVAHCPDCGADIRSPLEWHETVPRPWLWECACFGDYTLSYAKYLEGGYRKALEGLSL